MLTIAGNGALEVTDGPVRFRTDPGGGTAQGPSELRSREFRAVLYSHDTMGLGHLRRNQLVAMAIRRAVPEARILLVAGTQQATSLHLPPGIDCLTLPSLAKSKEGGYGARTLEMPLADISALRQASIRAAVESFDPDLFLADKAPRGVCGELDGALQWLQRRGRAHCILGLRDVLDDIDAVQREWRQGGCEQAIDCYYDDVWVYGDRDLYDLAEEYQWPTSVAGKLRYLGYLDQQFRLPVANGERLPLPDEWRLGEKRVVVCTLGGGQDGVLLANAFAAADVPLDCLAVLLTGPFLPNNDRRELDRIGAKNPRLRIVEYMPEPDRLLQRADRLIMMGGYNSVCAALSFQKSALVAPRVVPRREQMIRAERLAARGLVEILTPEKTGPEEISAWLDRPQPSSNGSRMVDMQGFQRVGAAAQQIFSQTHQAAHA